MANFIASCRVWSTYIAFNMGCCIAVGTFTECAVHKQGRTTTLYRRYSKRGETCLAHKLTTVCEVACKWYCRRRIRSVNFQKNYDERYVFLATRCSEVHQHRHSGNIAITSLPSAHMVSTCLSYTKSNDMTRARSVFEYLVA